MGRICFLALFFCSCTTSPKSTDGFNFPQRFIATQTVSIHSEQGVNPLIAQIERRGEWIKVVFVQPILQIPLVTLIHDGEDKKVKWHISQPTQIPIDPQEILELIHGVYNSHFPYGSDSSIKPLATGYGTLHLKGNRKQKGCLFPKTIKIEFKDRSKFWLNIVTEGLECWQNQI